MLSDVCHPGHVQDASQGLPGLFSFNWVDQWMMTRLNGFNLGGSSQRACRRSRSKPRFRGSTSSVEAVAGSRCGSTPGVAAKIFVCEDFASSCSQSRARSPRKQGLNQDETEQSPPEQKLEKTAGEVGIGGSPSSTHWLPPASTAASLFSLLPRPAGLIA